MTNSAGSKYKKWINVGVDDFEPGNRSLGVLRYFEQIIVRLNIITRMLVSLLILMVFSTCVICSLFRMARNEAIMRYGPCSTKYTQNRPTMNLPKSRCSLNSRDPMTTSVKSEGWVGNWRTRWRRRSWWTLQVGRRVKICFVRKRTIVKTFRDLEQSLIEVFPISVTRA